MAVTLECPVEGRTFSIGSKTREELEGRTIRCPVCKQSHEAVFAAESEPRAEPPSSFDSGSAPARLFPVGAIVLATFLGAPLGGGIVMGINYRRMGRAGAGTMAMFLGVLGTVAVIILAMNLPEKFPGIALWLPPLLLVMYIAKSEFEGPIAAREAAGIPPAGIGPAVGIGLACLAVLAGAAAIWVFSSTVFPGENLEVANDDVFYSGGATAVEARRLLFTLDEIGLAGGPGATFHLEKVDGGYGFGLILLNDSWNDAELVSALRLAGAQLVEAGFGPRLTIRMCDSEGDVRGTIEVE